MNSLAEKAVRKKSATDSLLRILLGLAIVGAGLGAYSIWWVHARLPAIHYEDQVQKIRQLGDAKIHLRLLDAEIGRLPEGNEKKVAIDVRGRLLANARLVLNWYRDRMITYGFDKAGNCPDGKPPLPDADSLELEPLPMEAVRVRPDPE